MKHPFTPVPFGSDLSFTFGNEFAIPVVGNFDPPATPINAVPAVIGSTNLDNRFDVNGDGYVTPLDVAIEVNELNENGPRLLPVGQIGEYFYDVSGEGELTPMDALQVIGYINAAVDSGGSGEGEFTLPAASDTPSVMAEQELAVRSLLVELSAGSELVTASTSQVLQAPEADVAIARSSERRTSEQNPTDALLADLDAQPSRSVLEAEMDDLLEDLTRDLADDRDGEAEADDFFSQLGA